MDNDYTKAVLNIARCLSDGLHNADLDMIDGAFYWELCHPDFLVAADAAREEFLASGDEQRLVQWTFEISDAFRISAVAVWGRVRNLTFVPLHAPDFYLSKDLRFLCSTVFSGATIGAKFAESAHQSVDLIAKDNRLTFDTPPNIFCVHVDMEFQEFADSSAVLSGVVRPGPHLAGLAIQIQLPLPSRETIASIFDQAMRENPTWHFRLPYDTSGAVKIKAIRTWAIGLLVGQGMPFGIAQMKVCEAIGTSLDFTRQADKQNRDLIRARVPDAKPFLKDRRPGRPPSKARKCKEPLR